MSDSTVSRVLNNQPGVKVETRERVMDVIRKMGFSPSSIARELVTGRSNVIAFVTEDIRNPYFAELARGVEDEALAHGLTVLYCSTDCAPERERMYLETFTKYRVVGLILTSVTVRPDQLAVLNGRSRLPFVLVNRYFEDFPAPYVAVDNFGGAYQATSHLLKLGHRKIAHITGRGVSTTSLQRTRGYQQALVDHGVQPDPAWIFRGDLRYETGKLIAEQHLLGSGATAVFAANDLMAIGVMDSYLSAGKRIPEDIAVVGFDDIPQSAFSGISLTTVSQPKYDMGRTSVILLMNQLDGRAGEPRNVTFPLKLVVRRTCGACR